MIAKDKIEVTEAGGLIRSGYLNPPGHFGRLNTKNHTSVVDFITCRESLMFRFTEQWDVKTAVKSPDNRPMPHIVFGLNGIDINRGQAFFKVINSKLKRATVPVFHPCHKNAVYIDVPNFWRATPIHHSFFSLFLRCAFAYFDGNPEHFDDALRAYPLVKYVRSAISVFLDGYTVPKQLDSKSAFNWGSGVVSLYQNASVSTMKEHLRKPKAKDPAKKKLKPKAKKA